MSMVFEDWIEELCKRSGYDYDFLVACYMHILDKYGCVNHESFESAAINNM